MRSYSDLKNILGSNSGNTKPKKSNINPSKGNKFNPNINRKINTPRTGGKRGS